MSPKRIPATKPVGRGGAPKNSVRTVAPAIEYLNDFRQHERMPISRFGIRVSEGQFWAIIKVGEEKTSVVGKGHSIPVDRKTLAGFVIAIIDDHLRQYPNSDLLDVLSGKKSFLEAVLAAKVSGKI